MSLSLYSMDKCVIAIVQLGQMCHCHYTIWTNVSLPLYNMDKCVIVIVQYGKIMSLSLYSMDK